MNIQNALRPFRSLSRQIVVRALLCSIFFTLLVTGLLIAIDYIDKRDTALAQLRFAAASYRTSLTTRLWELDMNGVRQQLDALANFPLVGLVELSARIGQEAFTTIQAGKYHKEFERAAQEELPSWTENLVSPEQPEHVIGQLRLFVDQQALYNQLRANALRILAGEALKVFVLGFLIVWLITKLVTRHIAHMAIHVASLQPSSLGRPLTLQRPTLKYEDELDLLCAAFNKMDGQLAKYIVVLQNAHDEMEVRVLERTKELARSNAELEQFAYIASHDLQEPLRMVTSYLHLLEQRYQGRLDRDADEFITFAVDGAKRMQELIKDLLTYSRVSTKAKPPQPVECQAIMEAVLRALGAAIEDSGAQIECAALPRVMGDETQVMQLFQNLMANALKFRGENAPRIQIHVEAEAEYWHFAVQDNGIGIAPEYFERIFVMFQRLHSRNQYPGNGIGLALCKKIVERHGGRIWVESSAAGTTFHFTLPQVMDETASQRCQNSEYP